VTIFLPPGLVGQSLTDHIIVTLAHEAYHAASFRTADRRRSILRQHLTYRDDRGFVVLEEILACHFAAAVAAKFACEAGGLNHSANGEHLRLGRAVMGRCGMDFATLNGNWLVNAQGAERFWTEQGDAVFRSLHLMPKE
jgi:hypothetical protein